MKLPYSSPKVRETCTVHDAWWFGLQLFTYLKDWAQIKTQQILEESIRIPEYKSQLTSKDVDQSERSIKNRSKLSDRAKSSDSGLPSISKKRSPKVPETPGLDPIFLKVLIKRFTSSLGLIQGEGIEFLDGLSRMGSQDGDEPSSLLTDAKSRRSSYDKRQTFGAQFHPSRAA